jgi:hypothetical protein
MASLRTFNFELYLHFHKFFAEFITIIMSEFADTYRLPTDVKPTHYEVTVRTDLEKLVFDGFVHVL